MSTVLPAVDAMGRSYNGAEKEAHGELLQASSPDPVNSSMPQKKGVLRRVEAVHNTARDPASPPPSPPTPKQTSRHSLPLRSRYKKTVEDPAADSSPPPPPPPPSREERSPPRDGQPDNPPSIEKSPVSRESSVELSPPSRKIQPYWEGPLGSTSCREFTRMRDENSLECSSSGKHESIQKSYTRSPSCPEAQWANHTAGRSQPKRSYVSETVTGHPPPQHAFAVEAGLRLVAAPESSQAPFCLASDVSGIEGLAANHSLPYPRCSHPTSRGNGNGLKSSNQSPTLRQPFDGATAGVSEKPLSPGRPEDRINAFEKVESSIIPAKTEHQLSTQYTEEYINNSPAMRNTHSMSNNTSTFHFGKNKEMPPVPEGPLAVLGQTLYQSAYYKFIQTLTENNLDCRQISFLLESGHLTKEFDGLLNSCVLRLIHLTRAQNSWEGVPGSNGVHGAADAEEHDTNSVREDRETKSRSPHHSSLGPQRADTEAEKELSLEKRDQGFQLSVTVGADKPFSPKAVPPHQPEPNRFLPVVIKKEPLEDQALYFERGHQQGCSDDMPERGALTQSHPVCRTSHATGAAETRTQPSAANGSFSRTTESTSETGNHSLLGSADKNDSRLCTFVEDSFVAAEDPKGKVRRGCGGTYSSERHTTKTHHDESFSNDRGDRRRLSVETDDEGDCLSRAVTDEESDLFYPNTTKNTHKEKKRLFNMAAETPSDTHISSGDDIISEKGYNEKKEMVLKREDSDYASPVYSAKESQRREMTDGSSAPVSGEPSLADTTDEENLSRSYQVAEDSQEIQMTDNGVTLTLTRSNLWEAFNKIGTEMIINRSGRRMFPCVILQLSGLEARHVYEVEMEVLPADCLRYKFVSNAWTAVGVADSPIPNSPYPHPDSPNTGEHWMSRQIQFPKVKLTNNRDSREGNVLLHSMHKYLVQVTVRQVSDAFSSHIIEDIVFRLDMTSFIAVTAYQNEQITRLKIHNNPFAKAFRDSGISATAKKWNPKRRHITSPEDGGSEAEECSPSPRKRERAGQRVSGLGPGSGSPPSSFLQAQLPASFNLCQPRVGAYSPFAPHDPGSALAPPPVMWMPGVTSPWAAAVGLGQGLINPYLYNLAHLDKVWPGAAATSAASAAAAAALRSSAAAAAAYGSVRRSPPLPPQASSSASSTFSSFVAQQSLSGWPSLT